MSASRIGRLSPSSVAQDWADRVSRSKGSDGQLLFPSEVPDLSLHVQRSVTGLSGHENKQYIQQVSSRDVRNSPVSTATHISQSQQQNDSGKCRQLPCRTFVSTGTCPYSDRCVFLHDPSIVSKPVFMKVKRKSKEDTVTDAFFWPTMPSTTVMGKLDGRNQPDIAQSYLLPPPGPINEYNSINDASVYSMWEHFVDFLATDPLSVVPNPRQVPPLNNLQKINRYSGKKRLPVLMALSQGNSPPPLVAHKVFA